MKKYRLIVPLILLAITAYCLRQTRKDAAAPDKKTETQSLRLALDSIISEVPGKVGIAIINATDTLTVNNDFRYPMMSVFKLHQALAVSNQLSGSNSGLDSLLTIFPEEIDRETWSPVIGNHADTPFGITIGELLSASLIKSDNNASNLLFRHIVNQAATDSIVRSIAVDTEFAIRYSESQMKRDHSLSYDNNTTPLAAATLIFQLLTDDLTGVPHKDQIIKMLSQVDTGHDRIAAGLTEYSGAKLWHKTGSGYRNDRGELTAHNDVGFIRLPDGRKFALAILICDFDGTEEEASALIAEITSTVAADWKR